VLEEYAVVAHRVARATDDAVRLRTHWRFG